MDLMKTFGRFNVRVLQQGDTYGLRDCLTHDKPAPTVEFYDTKHQKAGEWARGQFVSRYCLSTILERPANGRFCRLSLVGYEPAWTVNAYQMKRIDTWLRSLDLEVTND